MSWERDDDAAEVAAADGPEAAESDAAGAGAGAGDVDAEHYPRKQFSGDVLRVGVLGASGIAPNAVIDPARRVAGVEVVSVAARDPKRAAKYAAKHGIPRVHASYEELVDDPDIDAVYISLPNSHHREWTLYCCEAGKHVLCEKPLCNNADEAVEMSEAARQAGVVLFEAFHWMYHPMAGRLRDAVSSDLDGEIEHIEAAFCIPIFSGSDIRYNYFLGGGALMDTGCYAVSCVRHLSGEEPTAVKTATCKQAYPNVDQDVEASLELPSGASCSIKCSLFTIIPEISLTVVGRNGTTIKATNWLAPHLLYNKMQIVKPGGDTTTEKFDRTVSTYEHQLREFEAVCRDKDRRILTNPSWSVANMRVIDAIYNKLSLPVRGTEVD